MLHIGNKNINLAVKNAGVLYVGTRKMGPIINESSEPTPSKQGRFVIPGTNNKLSYSFDLLEWNDITLPNEINWVTFCDNKFVGVTYGSNTYLYSLNGEDWTIGTLPIQKNWETIASGNGIIIAVGDAENGLNQCVYSTDGINWSTSTIPGGRDCHRIRYLNGKFYALTNTTQYDTYAVSTDGINWTQYTLPSLSGSSTIWEDISYGNNKFIAISNSNVYAYSSDGINWTSASLPENAFWLQVCYGDNKFVITGKDTSSSLYSFDGINWTSSNLPKSGYWSVLLFNGKEFVTLDYYTEYYAYSLNGIDWIEGTLSSGFQSFDIAYGEVAIPPAPTGTTLHQYDRVDNKATVAGFWTDGNGQRYAVCVADAQYRSGSGMSWNGWGVDTPLPNYSSSQAALAAGESGTYNTDTILNSYTPTDYPAFNFARNALTITVDNKTFESCLPNLKELDMLHQDRNALDTYDPTLSSYESRGLSIFKCGGSSGLRSSTEFDPYASWTIGYRGNYSNAGPKDNNEWYGVCPIIEIPVDENGTVITN